MQFSHVVARRCVPTGIDLQGQVSSVFNFSSPSGILDLANSGMVNNVTFTDLILNVDIQSIVDGNL